jgi:hypothetical protein
MWSRLAESELHSSLIEDQTANWPGRFVPETGFLVVVSGKVFQQNEIAFKYDHFLCSHKLLNLVPTGVTYSQSKECTGSSYAYSST